jgi:hypothetical protein
MHAAIAGESDEALSNTDDQELGRIEQAPKKAKGLSEAAIRHYSTWN